MSDAEIAAVLEVANRGEIQQARMATENASAPEVRGFATAMMTGHQQALEEQQQLLAPRGITPAPSPLAQQIEQHARMTEQRLRGMRGPEFDRAYMQAQLEQHRNLLQLLDQQLIPNAQDPAYRAYLERLRDDVAAHLRNAERINREVVG